MERYLNLMYINKRTSHKLFGYCLNQKSAVAVKDKNMFDKNCLFDYCQLMLKVLRENKARQRERSEFPYNS